MIINDSFLSFQVHLFVFLFPMSLHELLVTPLKVPVSALEFIHVYIFKTGTCVMQQVVLLFKQAARS